MDKSFVLVAVAGLLTAATPAGAVTTIYSPTNTLPGYVTNFQILQDFAGLPATNTADNPTLAGAAGTYGIYNQDVSGQAVGPFSTTNQPTPVTPTTALGSSTNFLSILNGSYTLGLNGIQVISFVFGGLDAYNTVTLVGGPSGSTVLSGLQIIGQASPGQGNLNTFGRVTYDFGGDVYTSIIFSSNQAAFEVGQIYSAAPEPAAWAMMIVGFGLVGAAMRRRVTKVTFATA